MHAASPPQYRIAHVITRLELGGAQQNTLYCVANHDRERFQVHLLCGPGGILDDDARRTPETTVHFLPTLRHPISPLADCRAVLAMARLLRRLGIDLVHTHSSKAGIVGRLAARLAGVGTVVHTAHGWSFNPTQGVLRRRLYVLLERLAAHSTSCLVTVSEIDRRRGIDLGIGVPEQYRVIRSGIDVAGFREAPKQALLERRSGEIVVGTIACFKPQKDLPTLLRAARRVLAAQPQVRFVVAGDGEQRPQLEALIHELGIAERVQLLGWVRDVHAFLHDLDLFVLSSRFEGLPRAILQAMAAGVPVVATAVDGIPEVVEDGVSGLLAPAGDHEQLAACLLRLITDETLRQRLAARATERLTGSFHISRMLAELEEVYLQLLAAQAARIG